MGLGVFVFAAVALSSAGRIDVVDGHTRYDVGRSYVEHRDSIVRDSAVWFAVLPGRDGDRYSSYRFPQSIVAAAAILVSDLTGPIDEARRHFFFSLSGAVLAAAMALLYACWFRRRGQTETASLAWAAGGIFCTPVWFYSTTTFDDVLGSLTVLAAVVAAFSLGQRRPIVAANASGLLLAFAFNCKPPLALFAPVAVAALWHWRPNSEQRRRQVGILLVHLVLGIAVYMLYDLWKFPPSTWPALAEAQGAFVGPWPGDTLAGLLSILVSPGMGAVWYWPALIVAVYGLTSWWTSPTDRQLAWMAALSSAGFTLFIASIRFFSGEPAWGPRYLTPLFALAWIFVPAGVARLGAWKSATLLAMSFVVQVAGLSIDTMRFFSGDREASASRFLEDPWSYFAFDRSQLLARPRQVLDVLAYDGPTEPAFSPAAMPTLPWYVFVVESPPESQYPSENSIVGRAAGPSGGKRRPGGPPHDAPRAAPCLSDPAERLRAYVRSREPLNPRTNHVINSFRPWWASYRYLPRDERPVDLDRALTLLLLLGVAGLAMIRLSLPSNHLHQGATP